MYNKSTTDAIVYLLITFIIVTVGGIQGTICPTIINTNRTTTAIILISKTMLYVITEIMLLQQRTRYPRILVYLSVVILNVAVMAFDDERPSFVEDNQLLIGNETFSETILSAFVPGDLL